MGQEVRHYSLGNGLVVTTLGTDIVLGLENKMVVPEVTSQNRK